MPSPATIAGTRNAAAMCASGTRISAIGVGQDRDETIAIHDLLA
jgi:hypothetical protein